MNNSAKLALSFLIVMKFSLTSYSQKMKMGEVIVLSTSTLKKDVNSDEFKNQVKEVTAVWNKNKPGTAIHLFQADRGDRKGEFLLVSWADKIADRNKLPDGSAFTTKSFTHSKTFSNFLENPNSFVEYHLIGSNNFKILPEAAILGIHFIKVKPERSNEFEKFVIEKLNPTVGRLLPDMQLFYYKAVATSNNTIAGGEYITIFAIESPTVREKYWPTGAPETEALKEAFRPLKDIAAELGSYLVKGSYLGPASGGAAAYFESLTWTDFVQQDF